MAENDFQRASMRGLGKKILLGDESVEPIASPESPDDPAMLKLTKAEEQDLLATVSVAHTPHAEAKQEALPPLELDMPRPTQLAGASLPLSDDLQALVATAFESSESLFYGVYGEGIPPLENEPASFISLNPAEVTLPPEVASIIDENFEGWDQSAPPIETPRPVAPQPTPEPTVAPSDPAATPPAERNDYNHLIPLVAGWVVAILVLIYQLIKDSKENKNEKEG
ncbi:MAG: hypothetical protein HY862_01110 [Chloroflexi bacterium]|nr:hypothetical protein [Chloroflexota bacterium]